MLQLGSTSSCNRDWGRPCFRRHDLPENVSPRDKKLRGSSVETSEFEASRDFRTESTIESVPGKLWSLPLVIGVANPGFGGIAHSRITNRCTSRSTIASLRCRSGRQSSSAGELRRSAALRASHDCHRCNLQ